MSDVRSAALDYARRGWDVFPAPPGKKTGRKAAKHSGGRKWGKTRDPAEIERDWARWPDSNIGIACGPESGFWVLEIDTKAGHGVDGLASLEELELELEHGGLPPTLMAESPSGSVHYYWAWPLEFEITNSTSKIGPGIDVRGQGGMVIAPPSIRDDGVYRWLNNLPVAEAPGWLIELARKPERYISEFPGMLPDYLADANTGAGVSTDAEDTFAPPTLEEVKAALDVLDPDCDYETWYRIGAACKDFTDEFVEWSAKGSNFPGERDCRQKAAEFRLLTTITVATLFHLATEADPDWRKEASCGY